MFKERADVLDSSSVERALFVTTALRCVILAAVVTSVKTAVFMDVLDLQQSTWNKAFPPSHTGLGREHTKKYLGRYHPQVASYSTNSVFRSSLTLLFLSHAYYTCALLSQPLSQKTTLAQASICSILSVFFEVRSSFLTRAFEESPKGALRDEDYVQ